VSRGLLDTSVFIASESGRALDVAGLPDESYVCVVTLAELRAGVLAANDPHTRARRLATLEGVAALDVLVIDSAASAAWAEMRVALAQAGRRVNVNDLWIASVAVAQGMPVVAQDDDFDVLADLGFVDVTKV
jgi:predicted nucleic acid-binding protein